MRSIYLVVIILFLSSELYAQPGKMQLFKLSDIRLLESPFKQAEEADLTYMLKIEPDRLLVPYLREAGLKPKAPSYGNWESSGLDGHTAGHYLTALAQMYASVGNMECKRRLDYMVNELARCQKQNKDGYVGGVPGGNKMWEQVKTGNFSDFDKKWVPWYNLHKLYAGLRDAYLLGDNDVAKEVFIKLCDWADDEVAGLSTEQMQRMLGTEYGGMNEVIADAYAITGNKKYLTLAEKFSHKAILIPLEQHEDKLSGMHANTQIPKVIGFERIAELNNDTSYHSAANFFWNTVVKNRSISIGGNSVREHFNPVNNFATMLESEQGPESCNSNNMLKLSKMLFLDTALLSYIDFYERLLYNHILSSQHPVTGGMVYFTPIHPQHYRVYSTADQSFWCCVGTGMENHGKYGELIYSHRNNDLYVNLFIPSVLNWKQRGIEVTQQNRFPETESTSLSLKMRQASKFAIYIRKPEWVKTDSFIVKVNNQLVSPSANAGGYVKIVRTWKTGDRIAVSLPMKNYVEYLPDSSSWVSFLHGPIVMAAPTDTSNLVGLDADDSRWGHIASGPLYPLTTAPLLASNSKNLGTMMKAVSTQPLTYEISNLIVQSNFKNLKLIPFYKVHDTRYMLYWPVAKTDSIKQEEDHLALLDERYVKLAARTIDAVAPGEQQPENDHNMVAEKSETGIFRNMHWRNSSKFFSYRLRLNTSVKTLGVTYYGKESGSEFDIYLNDVKLIHVKMDGSGPDAFVTNEYEIPQSAKTDATNITIKFLAIPGSKTASIYDVRLMR